MDKNLLFIPDKMEAVDVTVPGNYVPVRYYCFSHIKDFQEETVTIQTLS